MKDHKYGGRYIEHPNRSKKAPRRAVFGSDSKPVTAPPAPDHSVTHLFSDYNWKADNPPNRKRPTHLLTT